MKRKEVRVKLSPNEEAQLIREEQERRRILRIQQVREQQRKIAQHVRQKVEQRRQQELELLAEELRVQWEQQQKERVDHLQRLYQESLSLLGQSHRNAKENEPDPSAADQKVESDSRAEERYRKALKELKLQRLKNQENQSRSVDARRKALEVEKIRAAKVASLPALPSQPQQGQQVAVPKPHHVVKKCDASSFAATHYHMPETLVDRETPTSQPCASVEAEQEVQRMTLKQRQEEQRRGEQQEKARLRGREALRREQLLQDRGRLLVELEHMQQTDLLRRRQQVGDMPRQIFEPLYKRQETQLDLQRDMEFAFEEMYSGERRVKGDLLCHLVPEPLPPPSTDSLCQDLDVTQDELPTTDQYQAERDRLTPTDQYQAERDRLIPTDQYQAEREGITPDSVEDSLLPKASDEGNAAPPRRGLKRLLTRIRTQRRRWSESEVVSTDSPSGQDSSLETGSLTTADKQSKADVEHSVTVADKTQELEEQRRREEELEKEKREQMEILEQLEHRRLQLEEKLSEAQRERAQLKTTSTEPTDSSDSMDPGAGHTMTMEERRRRLLQQKETHRRSVEVARQRLEEYKKALQLRYSMPAAPPLAVPPSSLPPALQSSAVPPTVPPSALLPTAVTSSFPPAAVPPSSLPPATVHSPFPSSAVPPAAVTPSAVPPATVPPSAVHSTAVAPLVVPPAAVPSVFKSSFVPPSALLPPAAPPTGVPLVVPAAATPSCPAVVPPLVAPPALLLPAVPLHIVTHSAAHPHHPGPPRAEEQTPAPPTVSRDMVPLRPPLSDSLTALRHKAFLKFLQDRLGVTRSDPQTEDLPSPPVSTVTGPSPISTSTSSSAVVGLDQVVSSGMGPSESVSSMVNPSPVVTHPGPPVSKGVAVEEVGPDLSGLDREGLELSQQEEDVPVVYKQQPRPKEQTRSDLLQALLRALERSNIGPDQPPISGSRSASSGCSSVVSIPPSAAPKPPVSRGRLGSVDAVLHQLSVIEEVNTPANVSLLTGEEAVTAEEFQGGKQVDSSASQSCSLSDFAQYMDSPQSLDFASGADYSGSSVVSSFKHPAEPDSRPQPSLSSTISTGSYITTDPDLHSQPDSERIPVESPSSSPAQQSSQNQEGVLDQGTAPQTPQFALVETAEALPTDEPSLLENEDSFRPLVAEMSDMSMCPGPEDVTLGPEEPPGAEDVILGPEEPPGAEDVTLGPEEPPGAEDVAPGLELLVGHPSAHSSVIGQMPGSSPLMAWDSAVSRWREGLSYVPSGTWQSTGQEFVPTERPLEGPESSADASTSSGFHQLHAEITHNQMETTEPLEQLGPELGSPEQMRTEPYSHSPVEASGILEQSQITLASLTDSSSDEQEPEVEDPQTWTAEVLAENMTSPHSLDDKCDSSSVHKLLRAQEFQQKILQRLRSKEKPQ